MKKKILFLMAGILLIGVNLYAEGDLIVNGHSAVGATATVDSETVLRVKDSFDDPNVSTIGLHLETEANPSSATNSISIALKGNVTTQNNNWTGGALKGLEYYVAGYNNPSGGANTDIYGLDVGIRTVGLLNTDATFKTGYAAFIETGRSVANGNKSNLNLTDLYGVYIQGAQVTVTNSMYGIYIEDSTDANADITNNLSGLWINKQTGGDASNYGIVLDGEDNGADIAFGNSQEARIYATQFGGETRLYAQDGSGNTTILSPHDPETGEWIYYSKNVKTGRTVRVNMEKLVKAVEKLTGETFMIETLMEDK